jgi:nucleoside-diphosphate-sugar epimerase
VTRSHAARALVTGAAGFIGSNLLRALKDVGAEVHAVIRPSGSLRRIEDIAGDVHLHRVDISDFHDLKRLVSEVKPQTIFHLAVSGGGLSTAGERLAAVRSNVLGTACLLEATKDHDYGRFVHVGSSLEYGPKEGPISESDELAPVGYRGITKATAALLVGEAARADARPTVILRPFAVYGPGQPEKGLIPAAIRSVLTGQELNLTPPGYRRDYVYVDDVVTACLLSAEAETTPGEVINVGSGRQWANEEVVGLIEELCGRRAKVRPGSYLPRPYDTASWVANTSKAEKVLGWTPQHNLREGLAKTIPFFRELWGL